MNTENRGFVFALLAAALFSSKGAFGKIIYAEGVSPLSLLVLRMSFAAPFYLGILWLNRQRIRTVFQKHPRDFFPLVALGASGYYVSSLFDFTGLQYLSTGLERVLLFLYPTFVVLLSYFFRGFILSPKLVTAIVLSYFGVICTYFGDMDFDPESGPIGVAWVLGAAGVFSMYMFFCKSYIARWGALNFTSFAMIVAMACLWSHHLLVDGQDLFSFTTKAYLVVFGIAFFLTVIPSLLMMKAVEMIGPEKTSIIGGMGPVMTLVLGYFLLGESVGFMEGVGITAVIVGGFMLKATSKN